MSQSLSSKEIHGLLDEAYERFATPVFIALDPIQVPRSFSKREDAETIGFITATIAWGQRKTIISNAWKLVRSMDEEPFDFVMHASEAELDRLDHFVHRTFNATDLRHFILGLRHLHTTFGGLEAAFLPSTPDAPLPAMADMIASFRERFFEPAHEARTRKHVADPSRGSNAKRINMFLRWMVRPNDRGVDLGLWKRIPTHALHVPLDVHTGRMARELGLLRRKQDDWKSVMELTEALRLFDAEDPVKYDIALFALGVEAGRTRL
ncbi:MAG: TIGR02757 family protein [Flavobacteriales bacterium]|nr:TIGR02757 family protein [Flavobacteriales bacterium]MBK7248335.1 TIGR02757 family protein [Flavobacteriales bacterium]MBK9598165.1 TIGR02757 family protein [Flavobacteriales bacterium]QQS73589.1 MAG: TIGR02757 family protein [Flavobacteriales bacterium]HQV37331.1 TIGR02757 family protein [Flavobacteriales bacterium]